MRVSGQFTNLDDIRNVPIAAGGRTIKLGDIATVTRGFEDPPIYTIRHNGQDVLMVGIVMTDDGNVVELGKAVEDAVAKVQSELPHGVELERVADQPTTVKDSVWEFERSLMEALAIVLAVSLLSLGLRTGLIVAISVPLVLGVVAMVMLAMGWNLERISLGSLIIALGLLVDDSIIAIEMMVVKMEGGWDRVKAAAFSYSATAMPRLSGALITVAGFMPIGFAHSTTAEYAGGIFWIVGIAVRVLVVLLGHHHALPRGEDAAEGLRPAPPRRRPVRHAVLPQAARLDRLRAREALADHRRDGGRPGARAGRHEVRAAAVLPEQRASRADPRHAHEGRLVLPGQRPNRSSAWKRC